MKTKKSPSGRLVEIIMEDSRGNLITISCHYMPEVLEFEPQVTASIEAKLQSVEKDYNGKVAKG